MYISRAVLGKDARLCTAQLYTLPLKGMGLKGDCFVTSGLRSKHGRMAAQPGQSVVRPPLCHHGAWRCDPRAPRVGDLGVVRRKRRGADPASEPAVACPKNGRRLAPSELPWTSSAWRPRLAACCHSHPRDAAALMYGNPSGTAGRYTSPPGSPPDCSAITIPKY